MECRVATTFDWEWGPSTLQYIYNDMYIVIYVVIYIYIHPLQTIVIGVKKQLNLQAVFLFGTKMLPLFQVWRTILPPKAAVAGAPTWDNPAWHWWPWRRHDLSIHPSLGTKMYKDVLKVYICNFAHKLHSTYILLLHFYTFLGSNLELLRQRCRATLMGQAPVEIVQHLPAPLPPHSSGSRSSSLRRCT